MDRRDTGRKLYNGWLETFNEKSMTGIPVWSESEDAEPVEIPLRFEVCPVCDGKGKHVNPSIDSHGISADEFAEDPDFARAYFRGRYDVPCNGCGGRRVVPMPLLEEDQKRLQRWQDAEIAFYRECEMERMMGA
jgi:hypothetical protein